MLAVGLLFAAALPVQIFAVPGFEITPALLLAPVALLLFDRKDKVHWAVVGFMAACGVLALFGMVGSEGRFRNIIGAASFTSGAPYILLGMLLAKRRFAVGEMWKIVAPIGVAMTVIFVIDIYLNGGSLLKISPYETVAYTSEETTYIDSFFPFYGKYAVITLATIAMVVGCLTLASALSIRGKWLRLATVLLSTGLIFITFSLWTRQVMLGIVIFYAILLCLAFRQKETWISLFFFLVLLGPWAYSLAYNSSEGKGGAATSEITPQVFGNYKFNRAVDNIKKGDLDDLSTGRMAIYRDAGERLDARISAFGCGFCNLKDVLSFKFSSLHNVLLTAVFKGGIFYAILYCGGAFLSLILLWFSKKSFGRDVSVATLLSIGAQSMVNDVLFFQVIPALMFALTGHSLANYLVRRSKAVKHGGAGVGNPTPL